VWITDVEYSVAPRIKRIKNVPVVAHIHSYALVCPWWGAMYGLREVCAARCSVWRIVGCKQGINRELARVGLLDGVRAGAYWLLDFGKGPLDYFRWKKISVANLFVFNPLLMLILMILIYLASQRVLKNPTYVLIASIMAFNLLQFHRNELTFIHANTRLYALVLLLLIFYILLSLRGNAHRHVAFFIPATTLAISHPLFQLVPPTMLLFLVALGILPRHRGSKYEFELKRLLVYLLIVALIVLAWNTYNYYNILLK